MAIVAEKSKSTPVDKKLCTPNRKLDASPVGVTLPLYAGEIVLHVSAGNLYYAIDLTNTGWLPVAIGV